MIDQLFFYGTLMSGDLRSHVLREVAEPVGPASIHGDLYVVGMASFPALVLPALPSRRVVHGELWRPLGDTDAMRLHNFIAAIRITDGIEGYFPGDDERSMYVREQVALREGGTAWTYRWNEPDHWLTARIESGSWREWNTAVRA